jgi:hypothetical protein
MSTILPRSMLGAVHGRARLRAASAPPIAMPAATAGASVMATEPIRNRFAARFAPLRTQTISLTRPRTATCTGIPADSG